mmetsp:Transcript_29595/g.49864  ORF Transcript_29595/g.49864 Transcript_29595/m.49864 type:complete len:248 (+) Transcript_29595:816-1559(+)
MAATTTTTAAVTVLKASKAHAVADHCAHVATSRAIGAHYYRCNRPRFLCTATSITATSITSTSFQRIATTWASLVHFLECEGHESERGQSLGEFLFQGLVVHELAAARFLPGQGEQAGPHGGGELAVQQSVQVRVAGVQALEVHREVVHRGPGEMAASAVVPFLGFGGGALLGRGGRHDSGGANDGQLGRVNLPPRARHRGAGSKRPLRAQQPRLLAEAIEHCFVADDGVGVAASFSRAPPLQERLA